MDDHLRELERLTQEELTEEIRAELIALLLRRVEDPRAKKLIEIASYCGDEAARRVVNRLPKTAAEEFEWVIGIPGILQDRLLALRVSLSIAFPLLSVYEMLHPDERSVRQSLLAAHRYLQNPSPKNKEIIHDVFEDLYRVDVSLESNAAKILELVGALLLATHRSALKAAGAAGWTASDAAKVVGKDAVLKSISSSLIPWALGHKDPLLDLVTQLEATSTQD